MNVALTPEMEALIEEEVASGRYPSAGEVVRDALSRFLESKRGTEDRFEALRRDLQKGIDDLDNGRYRDVRSSAAEMAEEFHVRGLQRLQSAAT